MTDIMNIPNFLPTSVKSTWYQWTTTIKMKGTVSGEKCLKTFLIIESWKNLQNNKLFSQLTLSKNTW
jgi:hypothetical protein